MESELDPEMALKIAHSILNGDGFFVADETDEEETE